MRTLQRGVKKWRGVMAMKLVYVAMTRAPQHFIRRLNLAWLATQT